MMNKFLLTLELLFIYAIFGAAMHSFCEFVKSDKKEEDKK